MTTTTAILASSPMALSRRFLPILLLLVAMTTGASEDRANFCTSRRAGFLDDRSSSGGADDAFRAAFSSSDAFPGPEIVVSVQRLVALVSAPKRTADGSVTTTTAPASKGRATTVNRTVHVLAQCARDQAAGDCDGFPRTANVCAISAVEGRVAAVLGSKCCHLRFEMPTPPLPLEEKISTHEMAAGKDYLAETLCVAVMIGMVVGALMVALSDRRTAKAAAAAAAARGCCRAPFPAMLALLVLARSEGAAAYGFTTHYFPQELDHFSFTPASSTVFNQRYLVNDSFWTRSHVGDDQVSGPIFVYTGNESPVEVFVANTGFMFDIAPKFDALLVFIEHRFYGESLPFGNHSYDSTEKLGYLTSTQALADYAILISSLKQNLSAVDSPVVVFGGSYGGMLAAWFRLKYPHVAIGALASSAPILMFDHITPWTSFYDALSEDYKSESLNCFRVIKAVWDVLYERGSNKTGLLELSKTFRACQGADVVQKAFTAASLYYNYTGTEHCFNIEKAGDPLGPIFQWQACTEMILPMTASKYSIFPHSEFSYDNRSADCLRTFKVRPRPHWVTTEYGGNKIEHVLKRFGSNVIFSNGMRDPLSRGGVLKNISSSIIALVAEKGAHHFDLRGATKHDPEWVVEQRRQEVAIIQGWIKQYYDDTA